jgi:hypothetical protein
MLTAGVRSGYTSMVSLWEAVDGNAQISLLVITQVTIAPESGTLYVYVEPVVVATPFTYHWNEGDEPPVLVVPTNVIGEEATQNTVPGEEVTDTDGTNIGDGLTATTTGMDVAVQPPALEITAV